MYKHCITFQPEKAIERLLKYGFFTYEHAYGYHSPKRQDKTEFYMEHLNLEDEYPLYGYYAMNYCRRQVTPIDAYTLGSRWANEMGFMRLSERCLIEFDMPEDKCVLGRAYGNHLCKSDYVGDDIEIVFSKLELSNVRMIAKPLELNMGYEHVTYRPVYLKSDNVMFSEDIGFQGDGYGDNYHKFGWKEPEEGYTFSQLHRMMSQAAWDDFVKTIIPSNYSSKEKAEYYKLIKDVKYIRR